MQAPILRVAPAHAALFSTMRAVVAVALVTGSLTSGCDLERKPPIRTQVKLQQQDRYEPYGPSEFFADGRAMRTPPEGTVPRGRVKANQAIYAAVDDYGVVGWMPVEEDEILMARGQERYGIYCAPCHGERGDGAGVMAARGIQSPSLVEPPVSELRVGELYQILQGVLRPSVVHPHTLAAEDRWAIIAHIRLLQNPELAAPDKSAPPAPGGAAPAAPKGKAPAPGRAP